MPQAQTELMLNEPRQATASDAANVEFLVKLLDGRDWMLSFEIGDEVLRASGIRWPERRVRDLAAASQGRIAGGQKGYKLVTLMTHEEYHHYRNWMSSQADKMKQRVIESDKVFYARKPVTL